MTEQQLHEYRIDQLTEEVGEIKTQLREVVLFVHDVKKLHRWLKGAIVAGLGMQLSDLESVRHFVLQLLGS